MAKFFRYFASVIAYWTLMFFGPALVMLFNNIGYYVTGGGWGPDSLMYAVLQFFSQPISCVLAYGAMTAILKENGRILVLVNCVIAACMCALFAVTASESSQRIAMIVSVAACTYSAITASKNIKKNQNVQTGKLEETQVVESHHEEKQRIRTKISKLKKELEESDKAYSENKKILAEAFSDDDLKVLVSKGEFPADKVNEYIEQRENLKTILTYMPRTRALIVESIGDLTKQLAELECEP